ncbi:MAG: hypothetical protein IJ437_02680 [Clostridia bacterium]|nr:hypothetical protein [Clostridia bacterium]
MQFFDLRRSNAVYIFRAIMDAPKTLSQISEETDIAEITVKKIAYKLIDESIISRAKEELASVGRPKLYLTPNPVNYSVFIIKNDLKFIFYSVNAVGERNMLFEFPANYGSLDASGSLQIAFLKFKQNQLYKHCHAIFFIDTNTNHIKTPMEIQKITPFQLIIKSLIKEERAIYIEYGENKAVVNYGKAKNISAPISEVEKIIDIDDKYILDNNNEIVVISEALRIITLKELEEKVAKLF